MRSYRYMVTTRETVENVPKLLRPNSRPDLVLDGGGGGFSICEAVGARDWRME